MLNRGPPLDLRHAILRIFRPISAVMMPVLRPFMPILRPLINVLADQRVRQVLGQLVFALALILFFWWMGSTAATELGG